MRERFDEIWESSLPTVSVNTTGFEPTTLARQASYCVATDIHRGSQCSASGSAPGPVRSIGSFARGAGDHVL